MRLQVVSVCLAAAVVLSGCGYDCHAKCLEIEDDLKYRHQETGLVDVRDPCDQQELKDATTCEQCEAAFLDVFREVVPNVTCDCLSSTARPDSSILRYYDSSCMLQTDDYSEASCSAFTEAELGDWETCAEQEQS